MISQTNSIISNGSITLNQYFIKVIDYDGTLLDEKYLYQGEEYTLPNPPNHQGLVFQEWNDSRVINNKITMEKNDLIIGATYTTVSGKSEFDIELTNATGLTINLLMDGTKEWGDGTNDTNTSHTYSSYGTYTIKCNGSTFSLPSSKGLFNQSSSALNPYVRHIRLANITDIPTYSFAYCPSLSTITISNDTNTVGKYSFYYCNILQALVFPYGITTMPCLKYNMTIIYISIPNSVTSIDSFENCYYLKNIVIPDGVTTLPDSAIYSCSSLEQASLSNNITSIGANNFRYSHSLKLIRFPGNITDIGNYAFYDIKNDTEYDFLRANSVPVLANNSSFSSQDSNFKIKVPNNLYSEWITSTNWVTYANNIYAGD